MGGHARRRKRENRGRFRLLLLDVGPCYLYWGKTCPLSLFVSEVNSGTSQIQTTLRGRRDINNISRCRFRFKNKWRRGTFLWLASSSSLLFGALARAGAQFQGPIILPSFLQATRNLIIAAAAGEERGREGFFSRCVARSPLSGPSSALERRGGGILHLSEILGGPLKVIRYWAGGRPSENWRWRRGIRAFWRQKLISPLFQHTNARNPPG